MRAKLTQSAILATTLLTVAGCKSGPGWKFWAKKDTSAEAALASAPAAPTFPSAGATTSAPSLTAGTLAGSNASQAGMTGGAAPSYAEQPAAATVYPQSYPATQTAEYTNPYAGGAAAVNATATAPAAGQPQQGAYGNVYQPAQQTNPYAAPTGNPYAQPSYASQQMPAGNSPQQPAGGYADQNYRSADPGYRTADVRSGAGYDAAQPSAERRYDASTDYSPDYTKPMTSDAQGGQQSGSRYSEQYQPGTTEYQPGTSEYTPGNTGYAPPKSYEQTPAGASTGAPVERRDPGYRPAGTGDYMPSSKAGGNVGVGFSTSATTPNASTPSKSGVVPAAYQWPNGERDTAAPARFSPEEEYSAAAPTRRSYE